MLAEEIVGLVQTGKHIDKKKETLNKYIGIGQDWIG